MLVKDFHIFQNFVVYSNHRVYLRILNLDLKNLKQSNKRNYNEEF